MCGILLLDGTETHEDVPQLGQQEHQAKVPNKQYVEAATYGATSSLGKITAERLYGIRGPAWNGMTTKLLPVLLQ